MGAELAVQVVNYRTREHLGACLDGVLDALAQTPVLAEVAVLDNASGDDLGELRERFAGRVAFSVAERNLGFGAAHNRLAAGGGSRWICLVNPDVTITQRDVFGRLLSAFDDPEVAVAGPLLRTPGGSPQRWDHGELRGIRARVANGAGHAYWRPRARRTQVAWVSGAFLLVAREAFTRAGGFDEAFFLYKEEEDLCLRIRRAGGRVLYVPDAEATHVGGVVAGRDPATLAASVRHYAEKHHRGRRRRVLDALHTHVTRRL